MESLEEFGKHKIKEIESKLARIILYVEIAVFIAICAIGFMVAYLQSNSPSSTEIGIVLIVAVVFAYMVGSRLWKIYNEIKQNAVHFLKAQKEKVMEH